MKARPIVCALCCLVTVPLSAGDLRVDGKVVSTAAAGPPLVVASTEKVENLNADRLDGHHAAAFALVDAVAAELALLQMQIDQSNALLGISQKTIFVTSAKYNGDLGGIDGAIVKCNEAARAAGLFGFYRPWLGTDGTENPAASMTQAGVPYVRTDGAVVAADWTDLTDGVLTNRIDRDEFGNDLSATPLFGSSVWSNVDPDGTTLFTSSQFSCDEWNSADFGPIGMLGLFASDEPGYWSASKIVDPDGPGFDELACSYELRLYCLQQ